MRIGVNTGEVLVGALRAGGDYTAMGDVVNIAPRLQTAAPPGGVLVGPATHAATESAIQYESDGRSTRVAGRRWSPPGWPSSRVVPPGCGLAASGRRSSAGRRTPAAPRRV